MSLDGLKVLRFVTVWNLLALFIETFLLLLKFLSKFVGFMWLYVTLLLNFCLVYFLRLLKFVNFLLMEVSLVVDVFEKSWVFAVGLGYDVVKWFASRQKIFDFLFCLSELRLMTDAKCINNLLMQSSFRLDALPHICNFAVLLFDALLQQSFILYFNATTSCKIVLNCRVKWNSKLKWLWVHLKFIVILEWAGPCQW